MRQGQAQAPTTFKLLLLCILLLAGCPTLAQSNTYTSDSQSAISAFNQWTQLVSQLRLRPAEPMQQLRAVNLFFNRFSWRSDQARWQSDDKWSSSFDTIRSQQGDCEDLSIAKFSTLLALGFKEEQLHLHYVFSRPMQSGHMVLSVKLNKQDSVLLDSLSDSLSPISAREDLQPIYHFNRNGLWIPKLQQAKRSHKLLPSWKKLLESDPILQNPKMLSSQLASL